MFMKFSSKPRNESDYEKEKLKAIELSSMNITKHSVHWAMIAPISSITLLLTTHLVWFTTHPVF